MMKLDGVAAFVAVADAGSISEAARRMGSAKSVVSERLAELERSVGARLVQRTTRRLSLTEDGLVFLERARRIVQETVEAAAELSERRGLLVGPLRISAPLSFGLLHLGPALYPFLKRHPGIDLTLDLDDRFVDPAADGYDAVIRHGALADSRLVAKHLASSRRVLVASPGYLAEHGAPSSIADLERHRGVIYLNRNGADWRFQGPDALVSVRPAAGLRVNNGVVMRDAAMAGLGIALLPVFMLHQALASGELQVVDVGLKPEPTSIYLAYPKDRRVSAKVRALTDGLRGAFGDPPYWAAGE
ncbi:LysR family transcriptional regulator [Phenylobacterium hankyongense]|uniref:LysR family transcriptional regulator n=1 Tax=Phenylobacterium hankyongense TaxID=1813876 RepID=A0A328AXX9_9CAUL|nr:LysR family transcriptional regulator [Phenylobacterium hankyongense]RAK58556.1 LysR family transcriptional regulator [Phenylobacterium hankyongense]